jgi:8-oxo-dGTP diphosphatase
MKEDCFHLGVKALIPNAEGKLLLLKRMHPKGVWDIPGGRIQKNESVEDALRREVYEETGLQNILQIAPFMMFLTDRRISIQNDDVGLILAVHLCNTCEDRPVKLSDEHKDYRWFEPNKAAELLMESHPKEFIEKIQSLTCRNRQGSSACSLA